MIDRSRLDALSLARGMTATPSNLERVAKKVGEENARWAFNQWELRNRAASKFTRASEMFFVREALEQATHERIAHYHASRFPEGDLVADLTTGIGADAMALAQRGPVLAFELDPVRAECAALNLQLTEQIQARVQVADSLKSSWDFEYAFADPARRVEGRRSLDPADFSPDPVALAERMRSLRLAGMKLSPLLSDEFLESFGGELEFVSLGGECRESLVWLGSEVEPGRWAVHIESGERLPQSDYLETTLQPAEYLFEADPAAIRAHCLGSLIKSYDLLALGDSNGYLTGSRQIDSPWLKGYRVLYHGKADLKATRRALRSLGADVPELKQRGAGMDLVRFRKEFSSFGSRKVYVAVWPVGNSLRHTIMEPQVRSI